MGDMLLTRKEFDIYYSDVEENLEDDYFETNLLHVNPFDSSGALMLQDDLIINCKACVMLTKSL